MKIDRTMKNMIKFMNRPSKRYRVLACCSGHRIYQPTIVVWDKKIRKIIDFISGVEIPRKRKFYKKSRKSGRYYIPEVEDREFKIALENRMNHLKKLVHNR